MPSLFHPRGRDSREKGAGTLLIIAMVLLLALLLMAIGHDRFSSQILWTSQRSTEGSLAATLAENAIEEARHELARRVNDPEDPLYLFFRKGQNPRPVDGLDANVPGRSHSLALLGEEAYRRFNYEGDAVEVSVHSQEPFGPYAFETRGILRYFSSVAAYPVLRPKDKVVREVEVRQEFKVSLIGPPSPFDRMILYIHNGDEFLGLDSPDEWANTNRFIEKMKADLIHYEKERDKNRQRLSKYAGQGLDRFDQVMRALDEIPFDTLRKIEAYESAYGRRMLFPDGPLALVALNASGNGFSLDGLGAAFLAGQEATWRAKKQVADEAEKTLRKLESDETWNADTNLRMIAILRDLSDFDQALVSSYVYGPFFANCRLDAAPRPIYNVIASDPTPSGGSAIEHYKRLLDTFSRDRQSFRQKFFFRVRKGAAGSIDEALARFRRLQDPVSGVVNGVVYVENPDEALHLTGAIPGKLVLIVEGDVQVSNLAKADDRSITTVISYGTMTAEGDINASLIPRGPYRVPPGTTVNVRGNLVLDDSHHWTGREPRLRGTLRPDLQLTSSSEASLGDVKIFPDRQLVVLSPATESRVVNR